MSLRLSIAADAEPEEMHMDCAVEGGAEVPAAAAPAVSGSSSAAPQFDSKRAKMDYFSKDCTQITEYLFVGGQKVASSEAKLREKGITHIINAAGDVCDNYFPDEFRYLKLHLLDSAQEDIMCVLYKVIDFIDAARKGKQRVLVHCQQGVSRSTVLVIAYLMYLDNADYDAVFEFVRARRGICRPNVGFMCQLLAWRKRVIKCSSRPHCLYRIGPHNARDRSLVTKWVDRVEVGSLDSRTLFLLQVNAAESASSAAAASPSVGGAGAPAPAATPSSGGQSILFLWVGMLCPRSTERQYLPYLAHLIAKLQAVEHAAQRVVVVRQRGREKIEKAEAVRSGTSPKPKPGSPMPHSPLPSSSASASASAPAFSSELVSASFHQLESAPAILAASSLSSLYPTASARETSSFYRMLGLEESDEYSRVGADCSHPISGALLVNDALTEDYPDVPLPDVSALNDIMLRHSSSGGGGGIPSSPGGAATPGGAGGKVWLLPPIVRGGGRLPPAAKEDDDDGMPAAPADEADVEMAADRFNRTPMASSAAGDGGSGSRFALTLPGRGGDESDMASPNPTLKLPPRLFSHHSPDATPPRSISSSPRISVLASPASAFASPSQHQQPNHSTRFRLSLPSSLGGDSILAADDDGDSLECQPVLSVVDVTSPCASSRHSRLNTSFQPSGGPLLIDDTDAFPSVSRSPSLRSPQSDQVTRSPWAFFIFPEFDQGPLPHYTRASLQPPNICLLHNAPARTLHVWMPPPGALFMPSKYEGDREAFANDIARIFQAASAADLQTVTIELAGKESEQFWLGF